MWIHIRFFLEFFQEARIFDGRRVCFFSMDSMSCYNSTQCKCSFHVSLAQEIMILEEIKLET